MKGGGEAINFVSCCYSKSDFLGWQQENPCIIHSKRSHGVFLATVHNSLALLRAIIKKSFFYSRPLMDECLEVTEHV